MAPVCRRRPANMNKRTVTTALPLEHEFNIVIPSHQLVLHRPIYHHVISDILVPYLVLVSRPIRYCTVYIRTKYRGSAFGFAQSSKTEVIRMEIVTTLICFVQYIIKKRYTNANIECFCCFGISVLTNDCY